MTKDKYNSDRERMYKTFIFISKIKIKINIPNNSYVYIITCKDRSWDDIECELDALIYLIGLDKIAEFTVTYNKEIETILEMLSRRKIEEFKSLTSELIVK